MDFDYKKEYKEFYLPPRAPGLVDVPEMNFLAVRGKGDPNQTGGEYQAAMGLLYGVAFTLKMSKRSGRAIAGYFDYVVPPLEGLWWMPGGGPVDYTRKRDFQWVSMIRLPEFVTRGDFDWAVAEAARKKETDFSQVEFFTYREELCVQCMHVGPYDDEPETLARMEAVARAAGYVPEREGTRRHHEIYLSDARRTAPDKLRTVIRIPLKKEA